MDDEKSEYIIPAWKIIKKEILRSFYTCNQYLNLYRTITATKNNPEEANKKHTYWILFVSEMVSLFLSIRTTLKENKKTSIHFEKLKVLETKALDTSKISYKEGITLFLILEEALYKVGVLKITIEEEDEENPFGA